MRRGERRGDGLISPVGADARRIGIREGRAERELAADGREIVQMPSRRLDADLIVEIGQDHLRKNVRAAELRARLGFRRALRDRSRNFDEKALDQADVAHCEIDRIRLPGDVVRERREADLLNEIDRRRHDMIADREVHRPLLLHRLRGVLGVVRGDGRGHFKALLRREVKASNRSRYRE